MSVQSPPGHEAHEEVFPLGVASWPQGNGPCGPFLNCVIMGIVHLRILAELEATVLGVVDGDPCASL